MFTVTYEKCVTADEKGNRRALTVRRKKDTKGPLGHEESLSQDTQQKGVRLGEELH